jgi:Copper amine oxidase, enzyme domain
MGMSRIHVWVTCLPAAMLLGCFAPVLFAHSGHTVWGGWKLDWEVKDDAGIAIRNVTYNNELVIYKASMPVIRVRYTNDACGPYADRINWGNLLDISNCGGNKVCQKSYSANGKNWLELGVLAGIGSYRIYQVWYLSHDGGIRAAMWSRGLQCNVDHDHHPYWRMDFDINGFAADQVFVFDANRGDEGWGTGWHKYTNELNEVKNASTGRVWFVRDNPTGHGMWVIPGPDGTVDAFSTKDVAPRRYSGVEDEPWPFGASGHLGYDNGEDIQEKDVVLWYVAHLHHHAAEGSEQWHWAGPWLNVAR